MQQYFGCEISLITNAHVIYYGTLYAIQCIEQTISLKDVYQINSEGISLTPYSKHIETFTAAEIDSIYLHQNGDEKSHDITNDVLFYIHQSQVNYNGNNNNYAEPYLSLNDQHQQIITTFSASTVDMTEFDDVDCDIDGFECDNEAEWMLDDMHIIELDHDDNELNEVDLDPFDGLDDVLDIEYIKSTHQKKEQQEEEEDPHSISDNKLQDIMDLIESEAAFISMGQNHDNSDYNVSLDEVLTPLSGFTFYCGSQTQIKEEKSQIEIRYIGDSDQEWNTCYGSFFIRSAHKNKIEMKINHISIPYGVCVGIVDGDKNDKSDSFHFRDRECYGFRSDGIQYSSGKLVGKWDKFGTNDFLELLVYNNTVQWLVNNVLYCIQYNIVPSRKYRLAISLCGKNNSLSIVSATKIENKIAVLKKKKKNKRKKKKQKKKKKKKKLVELRRKMEEINTENDEKQEIRNKIDKIVNKVVTNTENVNNSYAKYRKYEIGDLVLLKNGNIGIIKFNEKTLFSNQILYGLQLMNWNPNGHNGCYQNVAYFDAPLGFGFFAKSDFILWKIENEKEIQTESKYTLNDIHFGARALLTNGLAGSIRFIGKLHFDSSVWLGIDLKKPYCNGNDGYVAQCDAKYFEPKPKCGYFIKVDEVQKILPNKKKNNKSKKCLTDFPKLGDKVKTINGRIGTVLYIGFICLVKDICIGLKLDNIWPYGNDGSVKGFRYFTCQKGRGYFVRLQHLTENFGSFNGKNAQQKILEALLPANGIISYGNNNNKTHQDDAVVKQQPIIQQAYYRIMEKLKEIEVLEDRQKCGFFLFSSQYKKIEKKSQYLNTLNDIKNGIWTAPKSVLGC